MAIVVTDMRYVNQHVIASLRFRADQSRRPGSGCRTTPGGVTAFKFRDHDGHPLELLCIPGNGASQGLWRAAKGARNLFLGHPSHRHRGRATRLAAPDMLGSWDRVQRGSADLEPRTRANPISTTSTASTLASACSGGTPRHDWNCFTTTWVPSADPAQHRQQRHRGHPLCRAGRLARRDRRGARPPRHAAGRGCRHGAARRHPRRPGLRT